MSGGVDPTNDTTLPKEEQNDAVSTTTRRSFLNFRHLNCLTIATVLFASGMVSIGDLAFVIFSLIYIYILSKFAFPQTSPKSNPPIFGPKNKILAPYVLFAAVIGLFLPVLYMFEGIIQGDKDGIRAAAPHLFLLASQVCMEGVSFSGNFSLPIRVFVPVFYNSKRIFTIVEWLRSEIDKYDGGNLRRRLYFGRALAVVNMAFWCFNLFCFLLPVFLPKAFKIYYSSSSSRLKL